MVDLFETGDCLRTGTTLGRYAILGTIGGDSTGTLYRVRQESKKRLAVLRVLDPELASDPKFKELAARQIKLRHPNVQRTYVYGRKGSMHYMAMEYMAGRSLRWQLENERRMDPYECLKIIRRVGVGLRAARAAELGHWDLRPANILLSHSGQVKVIGIGMPKDPRKEYDLFEMPRGMLPFYTAPEILRNDGELDERATVFSLGAILYHMLSGSPAMYGATLEEALLRQASHGIEPLWDYRLGLPREVCELVDKALQPYPLRHKSIRRFLKQLVGLIRLIKTNSGRYKQEQIAEESAVKVCFKK